MELEEVTRILNIKDNTRSFLAPVSVFTVPQEPGPSINTEAGSWLVNGGQEEFCFPSFSITPSVYTFLIAGRLVHNG